MPCVTAEERPMHECLCRSGDVATLRASCRCEPGGERRLYERAFFYVEARLVLTEPHRTIATTVAGCVSAGQQPSRQRADWPFVQALTSTVRGIGPVRP